ncbi:MAG: aldehyde dehydrogenase family protein [Candidatus Woesearchaeota archaeon]
MNLKYTTSEKIKKLVKEQQHYYQYQQTKSYDFRVYLLKILRKLIIENEQTLLEAVYNDLGKNQEEAYITEIVPILSEINHTLKNLKRWMRPVNVSKPLQLIGTKNKIVKEPYGVVVIIAPWNYPIQLALSPLIGAIAAGNCCIVKPSEISSHTSQTLYTLISTYFQKECVAVIQGDAKTTTTLLEQEINYIFFTGGTQVGKIIQTQAAQRLIPTTLELGGKSPCIIDKNLTHLEDALKKIWWGKTINSGQTCIAPDFLCVHESQIDKVVSISKKVLSQMYASSILEDTNFGKIVSEKHFQRLTQFVKDTEHEDNEIVLGGKFDEEILKIEPTLVLINNESTPLMQEEIFGPILPIITYKSIDEIISKYRTSYPLALYIFSNYLAFQEQVHTSIQSGGVCINDVILQVANNHLPFGGVQTSGVGRYHGKYSFDTFTYEKSILIRRGFNFNIRYPPYPSINILKKFLRF